VGRSDLVKVLYRLGRQAASGVVTIGGAGPRDEVLVLRRGGVVCSDSSVLTTRLVRLAALELLHVRFEGGVTAYPPGSQHVLYLAGWARAHLEQQLDGSLADVLVRELAGTRLSIRPELAPEPADEADRRMLAAMVQPRRLDQIWPLARTPRFRLLAFLHFLRAVDVLVVEGVAARRPATGGDPRRAAALRLLGITEAADLDEVKRAYRRLARSLHPDLRPDADDGERRALERRFAEVTAAYEALL